MQEVPKGTPHAYGNARRGQQARYLLVMTPKIRALVEALHAPGASGYPDIFRAHDSEIARSFVIGAAKPSA